MQKLNKNYVGYANERQKPKYIFCNICGKKIKPDWWKSRGRIICSDCNRKHHL